MESDAYLEFKWKGDKFFIYFFFHAAFALSHSQILLLLPLSNGQWGQTGESEVEKGKRKSHLCHSSRGRTTPTQKTDLLSQNRCRRKTESFAQR